MKSSPYNYYGLDIKSDHTVKQDNSGVWNIDLDGVWKMLTDNTAVMAGHCIIKKLDKDSLVVKVGNYFFRHVREPLPLSDSISIT